ncbi:hypothetical protein evm_002229 [Chilo suppressalis]|nr:hypothetical protein evm_002229 [Chilo suppressalis]
MARGGRLPGAAARAARGGRSHIITFVMAQLHLVVSPYSGARKTLLEFGQPIQYLHCFQAGRRRRGPRSARSRDKGNSSARKRVASPKSPKASTSGLKSLAKTMAGRKRLASESSELSESSNSAPPARLEDVAGVEPEVQRTPRKIDGVKAGPLQLKGAAKQNIGKKNSKLTKFENDEDTVSQLGPIPSSDSKLFVGLHFLLTCTDTPRRLRELAENVAEKTENIEKPLRALSIYAFLDGLLRRRYRERSTTGLLPHRAFCMKKKRIVRTLYDKRTASAPQQAVKKRIN